MADHSDASSDEFDCADFDDSNHGYDEFDLSDNSDHEDTDPNFKLLDILVNDTELLAREHEEISKMIFLSEEDAYSFFNNYAKGKGFSIRRGHTKKRENGSLFYRQFYCSRAGLRQRKYMLLPNRKRRARPLTRVTCPVKFCIKLDWCTGEWRVGKFVNTHNHVLARPDEVCFLRSHRKIKEVTKAKILALQLAGLRKHQIMDALEQESCGYKDAGMTAKDLYNFAYRVKIKKISDGDAKTVLNYLRERRKKDPDFFFRHEVDSEGHLTRLFWADAQSRIDYRYFGDVLVFDSTYRVNRYNLPFIAFVGGNNHVSTTIFGCAVVIHEDADSYIWILKTFLEAMYQRAPTSVITDGDHAMRKAIKKVFATAHHRICSWHIERNIIRHLNPPKSGAFKSLLYDTCDPDVFEKKWKEFVKSANCLKKNQWVNMMYKHRTLWAAAYLKKKMFLGMRSNQRSESLNSRLHRHLDRKMSLLDLMEHYEFCLTRVRRNEAELDCKASQSTPVTTTDFKFLEEHAARIYTPKVFYRLREELEMADDYDFVDIIEGNGSMVYKMVVDEENDDMVTVECVGTFGIESLKCTCMKFECEKLPCSHIFAALVDMEVNEIPECCIAKRWTKNAKSAFPSNRGGGSYEWSDQAIMFRDMSSLSNQVLHMASKSKHCFLEIMDYLSKKVKEYTLVGDTRDVDQSKDKKEGSSKQPSPYDNVLDPIPVDPRGGSKRIKAFHDEPKKNKCGYCNQRGHTRPKCPKLEAIKKAQVDQEGGTGDAVM